LKVLLDESVPRLVKTQLPEFEITTVQEMGWTGLKNGDLLKRAEEKFDVFVTADKNLRFQQSLSGKRLSVIVLPSNQVPVVVLLLSAITEALRRFQPGTFVEIPGTPAQ